MLEINNIRRDQTVICSPSARVNRIFGEVNHLKPNTDSIVTEIIGMFHEESEPPGSVLTQLIKENDISHPVFGCTEISAQAAAEGINGHDTLQVTIEKIVSDL
jgi:hypothetical protein